MSELPPQSSPAQPQPDRDLLQPEDVGARVNRHERKSVRTHVLLGLGLLLLALLLGRGIYENYQLRQGNNRLADAVGKQSLQLTQIGTVQPVLGSGFVQPGTVLSGPDGKQYVCAPSADNGNAATAQTGTAGTTGAAGIAGATGETGVPGAIGATGLQGSAGNVSVITMDTTYGNYAGGASGQATVNIDSRTGQGDLRFNLPGTQNFVVQDNGTTFVNFQNNGDVTFLNNVGVGDAATNENITNGAFVPNGDDLFVTGDAGVAGRFYSNTGLTVGASTAYNDGTIATSVGSPGAGDLSIIAADDLSLTATGNDILMIGRTNLATLAATDAPLRLSNVAVGQAANLQVGSAVPTGLDDEGSLYLRDNAGTGELWLSDGGGVWRQIAMSSGNGAVTLDQAYNNFGATPATVTVDGAQGQGNLTFNLSSTQDFVIQDAGTVFATFADTGQLTLNAQTPAVPTLAINQTTSGDGLQVTGSGVTGNLIDLSTSAFSIQAVNINDAAGAGAILVNSASSGTSAVTVNATGAGTAVAVDSTSSTGVQGRSASSTGDGVLAWFTSSGLGGTLNPGSGALRAYADSEPLGMAGDGPSRRAGIFTIETNANDTDTFNFIALNADINGNGSGADAKWRVDSSGSTFADGPYSGAGADFAEYFANSKASLAVGDVVAIDSKAAGGVVRATAGMMPIGVVSERPAFIGNNAPAEAPKSQPGNRALVGLVGQLRTRVNASNGPISIGDLIAPSDVAGEGRRAFPGEPTIGLALTGIEADRTATVLIMPRLGGLATQTNIAPATVSRDDAGATDYGFLQGLIKDLKPGIPLLVDGAASFGGAVSFSSHIKGTGDTAGSVSVPAGRTTATVKFATPYESAPKVVLAPHSFADYRLSDVSKDSFTVELQVVRSDDVQFDWFAIGVDSETVQETSGKDASVAQQS